MPTRKSKIIKEPIRDITNTANNSPSEIDNHPETMIFTGFSKLPANAGLLHSPTSLAIELEVDPYDMRIVDAACTCIPALGQKLLTTLMVGRKITEGFDDVINAIRERYLSVTQRALIAAIDDLERRYLEFAGTKDFM